MKSSTTTTSHIEWGEGCSAWWLHRSDKFTVIQEKMPAGTAEKIHFHQVADQFFYCLEGTLCIQFENVLHELKPYEGLFVPSGQRHTVQNHSSKEVSFLVVSAPDSYQDRVDCE